MLGPLLFIIYTNDLPNAITHSNSILFADDTTIYESSNNLIVLREIIEKAIPYRLVLCKQTLSECFENKFRGV